MTNRWVHSPVALRFISKDEVFGVSGVHLVVLDSSNNSTTDFILTFNAAHVDDKYRVIVSGQRNTSSDSGNSNEAISSPIAPKSPDLSQAKSGYQVDWFPAKIIAKYPLTEDFNAHLNYFRQNGFALIPQDAAKTEVSILKIAFANETIKSQFKAKNSYTPIQFSRGQDVKEGMPIDVVSFPFNFNNSLLFSNFVSEGSINYSLKSKNNSSLAFFTDARYMENMIGGVAYQHQDSSSPGLILGNLKKLNGDGDLTIILSWSLIWQIVSGNSNPHIQASANNLPVQVSFNKLDSVQAYTKNQANVSPSNSIIPIQVRERFRTSWGSSVLYNGNTLVTNFHVIKPFVTDPTSVVEIHIGSDVFVLDRKLDKVVTPAENILDLSFIILSLEHSERIQKSHHNPAKINRNSYQVGDLVYSQGYGLFFNSKHQFPITSRGIINTTLALPIDKKNVLNSIIITSASCWNGSSGGGLFSCSNELLGLVCSNAQVFVPSLEDNSDPKTEKVSRISFVLPIDIMDYCYRNLGSSTSINPRIGDLWQLKSFHEDVVLEASKL